MDKLAQDQITASKIKTIPTHRIEMRNSDDVAYMVQETLSDGSVAWNVEIVGQSIRIGAMGRKHAIKIVTALNEGAAWVTT